MGRRLGALISGPTRDQRAFLEEVRASLVRTPSEDQLFDAYVEWIPRRSELLAKVPLARRGAFWRGVDGIAALLGNPRLSGCLYAR